MLEYNQEIEEGTSQNGVIIHRFGIYKDKRGQGKSEIMISGDAADLP